MARSAQATAGQFLLSGCSVLDCDLKSLCRHDIWGLVGRAPRDLDIVRTLFPRRFLDCLAKRTDGVHMDRINTTPLRLSPKLCSANCFILSVADSFSCACDRLRHGGDTKL